MSWLRAFVSWIALAVLMVINGIAREGLLAGVDPLSAHQISSIAGVAIILLASLLLVPWIGADSTSRQLSLGLAWVVWTVVFEFAFGHWVAGHSWHTLLADYDLSSGRLWSLVLFATAISPWLAGRLLSLRAA